MASRLDENVEIKLEGNTGLQTYLETFNNEIESNDRQTIAVIQEESDDDDEDVGTYFVDNSGNYYYKANKDSEPVLTEPPPQSMIAEYVDDEDEDEADHAMSAEPTPSTTDESDKKRSATDKIRVIQSEDNEGEVSYVFIMDEDENNTKADGEEGDENNSEEKVYEFEDGEEPEVDALMDEEENVLEDDKSQIRKVATKRQSSNSSQVHMCNYCNYTTPKRYLLSRHMKSHSEERPFKCSVCERGFKTVASLQNHVNTHTGTKPHHCKFCESAFTTSGELVRHVRYKHTHEKPHKCTECDYASVELSKLKRHIRCHTGERPYQCPHCTYASPDTFKLKRHLRIHTGEKPYECDVCHARFTQSNSLKAHKLIHSVGDKPVFNCELCPTTCGRKTDLRIHVQKLHTSETPLKCKRCGNLFPDRYSYKLHAKTHEGEKCYKCELCPYASISARHLESHMLIHTDQKPYQCESCDQSFRQKQLLKRHVNLYHNPHYVAPTPKEKIHKCPNNCNRSFRHKGNLIRHMAMHDPESSAREQSIALKLGRQKRIQIIDGQPVEIYSGGEDDDEGEEEEEEEEDEEEEEEDEDGEEITSDYKTTGKNKNMLVNVEGDDGQQYVVVEVIHQLQEEDNRNNLDAKDIDLLERDPMAVGDDFIMSEFDDDVLQTLRTSKKLREEPNKMLADDNNMANCFGFDDDEDRHHNELEEIDSDAEENKANIQMLDYVEH